MRNLHGQSYPETDLWSEDYSPSVYCLVAPRALSVKVASSVLHSYTFPRVRRMKNWAFINVSLRQDHWVVLQKGNNLSLRR